MSIFARAKYLFDQGDYAKALDLYETAGETYGREVVQYNIERCKEALGNSLGLDETTRLFVKNQGGRQSKSNGFFTHSESLKESSKDNNTSKKELELSYTLNSAFSSNSPETTNDFTWFEALEKNPVVDSPALSIVIPTFNRSKLLSITLACLVTQITKYDFEVIVADDGSSEDIITVVREFEFKLDLKYVRQPDNGYQLCAIRNLGLRASKYLYVAILDCDMAPDENWVESYIVALIENEDIAYIGPRKYIDTTTVSHESIIAKNARLSEFAEIPAKKALGRVASDGVSKDWRLTHFEETDSLRLSRFPFRFFSCGNVAFAKKWLQKVGWFDEEFNDWGGEDNEFGYRLFRAGCFFKSLDGAMAFHQEPPGAENETDRNAGKKVTSNIVLQKVPIFYRKPQSIEDAALYEKKLVSVIVTGEHSKASLDGLVSSALNQTIVDLQVQILSSGLPPDVKTFAEVKYGKNHRVKLTMGSADSNELSSVEALVNSSNSFYVCFILKTGTLAPKAIESSLELLAKSDDLNYVDVAEVVTGETVFKLFSSRVFNLWTNANKLDNCLTPFGLKL